MDRDRFDALARLLATEGSRRTALGAALGTALLGTTPAIAAKKNKKKRKRKQKQRRRRRNRQNQPQTCFGTDICEFPSDGQEFENCNLAGTDIPTCDGCDFRRADLGEADLSEGSFQGVSFRNANLRGANLEGADVSGASFREACLADTNLFGANTDGAHFGGAILCNTVLPDGTVDDSGCDDTDECCPPCLEAGDTCVSGGCCGNLECCPNEEGSVCVNLNSNEQNCGECGNACPENAVCDQGVCGCDEGFFPCDGQCIADDQCCTSEDCCSPLVCNTSTNECALPCGGSTCDAATEKCCVDTCIAYEDCCTVGEEGVCLPNTNDENEAEGLPHVEFVSATATSITLDFVNDTNSLSFFEFRIDGEKDNCGTPHPVISGDVIYPGVSVDSRNNPNPVIVQRTFDVNQFVEIRLALGGERDWDFSRDHGSGWTRFSINT
jgi:hypothetical protein